MHGWCAPGQSPYQAAQEEAGNTSLEERSPLAVAAPVHKLELGPRVAGERLPQPLGVANGDLLVLATVDDQHRNAQTGRRGGGRRARDVGAEEEPPPEQHQLDERLPEEPEVGVDLPAQRL